MRNEDPKNFPQPHFQIYVFYIFENQEETEKTRVVGCNGQIQDYSFSVLIIQLRGNQSFLPLIT